jgi:hypothetical protein
VAPRALTHYPAGNITTSLFLEFQRHCSQKLLNIAGHQIREIFTYQTGKRGWILNCDNLVNTEFPAYLSFLVRLGNVRIKKNISGLPHYPQFSLNSQRTNVLQHYKHLRNMLEYHHISQFLINLHIEKPRCENLSNLFQPKYRPTTYMSLK